MLLGWLFSFFQHFAMLFFECHWWYCIDLYWWIRKNQGGAATSFQSSDLATGRHSAAESLWNDFSGRLHWRSHFPWQRFVNVPASALRGYYSFTVAARNAAGTQQAFIGNATSNRTMKWTWVLHPEGISCVEFDVCFFQLPLGILAIFNRSLVGVAIPRVSPGEGPESVVQRILSASMPSPVGQFWISECFEQKR